MSTEPLHDPAHDRRIDYIEMAATDVAETRRFYAEAFGWKFTDYGPDYTSFEDGRLSGGFYKADATRGGSVLVVVFALDLAAAEERVRAAGGRIVKPAFAFPGGRRFHFTDPSGTSSPSGPIAERDRVLPRCSSLAPVAGDTGQRTSAARRSELRREAMCRTRGI